MYVGGIQTWFEHKSGVRTILILNASH